MSKYNLWRNYPDKYIDLFEQETEKINFQRVYYLLIVLMPIAFMMYGLALRINDTRSIIISHLFLFLCSVLLFSISLLGRIKKTFFKKLNKLIVDTSYCLLILWSFTLLGYNPENLIVFIDVVIVVMLIAFFYITTWQKLLTIYSVGLCYLFLFTPYMSRGISYAPLLTTSVFTVIVMFFASRLLHQYYLSNFIMHQALEDRGKDLEKKLALAINKLHEKEKLINQEVIRCLVKGVEVYDGYTRGHSENVANYARDIAKEMGLTFEIQEEIQLAGWVHDVGKILIPNQILNKPTELSKEERAIIQQHCRFGFDLLCESKSLTEIATWVLHHHERWDGKGYPNGLRRNEIPLASQILCVADAYDAITSKRVYKKESSKWEALQEIKRCSGSQFSPIVVEAFLQTQN